MNDLKGFILEKSKDIGIDICKFTDCKALFNIKDYLNYRIENNISTSFEEKDLRKRLDPRLTLESCNSIIVLAMSYNIELVEKPDYKLRGILSKSSWGLDYHKVLGKKIEELIGEIKSRVNFEYKYFVDTGPLVDRELAKKSGIGYYGKNASIINPEYGSFIFLGYILTDLDIEKDEEIGEECGDCDLCIRACPTGALESPYRVNAKKCISYLTQTKDEILPELRSKMGVKVYGCDTCQNVCPKNKRIKKSANEEFYPRVTKGYMDIEEMMDISNRSFKRKYGHMAGSWRGRKIIKRNSIIALGNMKDPRNIGILEKELENQDEIIREYAKWAIGNIYLTNFSQGE